ncbi:MAG: hypothetical protein ACRDP7_05520 [Trebonia sp.]
MGFASVWASARQPGALTGLRRAGCRVLELDVTDERSRAAVRLPLRDDQVRARVTVRRAPPRVAPFGIRVTLVQPGAVRTRFTPNSERHPPAGDGSGPYAAYKANVAKMAARAHREWARGVLGAAVILKAVTAPRAKARYKAGSQARLAPVARRVLGERLRQAAASGSPEQRLAAGAAAYVRFADEQRALFQELAGSGLDKERHPEVERAAGPVGALFLSGRTGGRRPGGGRGSSRPSWPRPTVTPRCCSTARSGPAPRQRKPPPGSRRRHSR